MSKSPDCIVVGGGVVGLTIARRLALDGLATTLLERDRCGAEASWAAAGVLSPCSPHRCDPLAILQERSLALYEQLCPALFEETGIDPEYEVCGELQLAFDKQGLGILQSDARAGQAKRTPDDRPTYELLSSEQTQELEPAASTEVTGALACNTSAQVRNPRLLRALITSCRKAGVDIRERAVVCDIVTEAARVSGVRYKFGGETSVLSSRHVVWCAGAWSSQITDQLRELISVQPVRGQMILMKLDERPFRRIIARGKTYLVPRRDGHVLLGATEEPEAGFVKRTTAAGIAQLIDAAIQLVPKIAEAQVVATWAGLRPGTNDDKPYIGPVPGLDGLIAATGHFRSGLTLAPATADVVSGVIHCKPYDLDLSCCLPGRESAS